MNKGFNLDLSVVIPSFGNRGHIPDMVNALRAQHLPVREIIVSHSGPGDPTSDIQDRSAVRLVRSDTPLYSGAARNAGARAAEGQHIAFLDDDVIPGPDWSSAVATTLREHPDDCIVGSIGFDTDGGYWGLCLWFVEFGSMHPYMPAREVEGGASANMFLSRDLFERAGGFPEQVNRSVDVEFMLHCRALGSRTRFSPAACTGHRNIGGFGHCMKHARSLGLGSARVRLLSKMRGDLFIRYPFLAPALLPARFAMMGYRVARWGKGERLRFLRCAPGILVALAALAYGFFRQARQPDPGSVSS